MKSQHYILQRVNTSASKNLCLQHRASCGVVPHYRFQLFNFSHNNFHSSPFILLHIVCNPQTQTSLQLPWMRLIQNADTMGIVQARMGAGGREVADIQEKYKVVAIGTSRWVIWRIVEIYDSSTNSWTRMFVYTDWNLAGAWFSPTVSSTVRPIRITIIEAFSSMALALFSAFLFSIWQIWRPFLYVFRITWTILSSISLRSSLADRGF